MPLPAAPVAIHTSHSSLSALTWCSCPEVTPTFSWGLYKSYLPRSSRAKHVAILTYFPYEPVATGSRGTGETGPVSLGGKEGGVGSLEEMNMHGLIGPCEVRTGGSKD